MTSVERQLENAFENGLIPIAIVSNTSFWAQQVKSVSCGPIHPEQLSAFGDFMHDLVARYSQPPYGVKYWEF